MSIEEKDGHNLAAAESCIENENQKHPFSQERTPDTAQAAFEKKGEAAKREVTTSGSGLTEGRYISNGKDGLEVAKQREAQVLKNRAETAKLFDRKRR